MNLQTSIIKSDTKPKILFLHILGLSEDSFLAKTNLSIVLGIDEQGVPIDFEISQANCSYSNIVSETTKKLIKKYALKECYLITNEDLNLEDIPHTKLETSLGLFEALSILNPSKEQLNDTILL